MTLPTSSTTAGSLLAVATSSPQGSLALAHIDGQGLKLLGHVSWEKKAMHSELATVKLEELLRQTGKSLNALTHIAVVNGPGSFTGIRVGINLARTLAYGLGLPAATFNALSVLACKHLRENERGLFALKAVQHYYYAAVYERHAHELKEILPPRSMAEAELAAHGRAWIEGRTEAFNPAVTATDLIEWLGCLPSHFSSWKDAKPLYIRASEAEEKLRQGLLKPLS
jgi:tRNA threonylcarbamoyl adenosine modification protein YeaZ